jgi:HEAT repeat protein
VVLTLEQAVRQLDDKASGRRKSAARRLRRLADASAGPALLRTLLREIEDSRTWEAQYQMIMALGSCNYRAALPELKRLAARVFKKPAVYSALGDAIVRLDRSSDNDATPVRWCIESGNDLLASGALQAMATLRMVPGTADIDQILDFVEPRPERHFWVAIAGAGWAGPRVRAFLSACAEGSHHPTADAATSSLRGEYTRVDPF